MPSDERLGAALSAIDGAMNAYHSAVAETAEAVRGYLASHSSSQMNDGGRARVELGVFATAHIDAERFAQLAGHTDSIDVAAELRIGEALRVLRAVVETSRDTAVVRVPTGGSLRSTVAAALTEFGRAFGAARVVRLERQHRSDLALESSLLRSCPPEMWSAAERQVAPPLVVDVEGADLRAGDLAEFLDGRQHIVLLVRGECPPAALVRLITPGTFVAQTADGSGLDRFAAFAGPAVIAWVPESAARFVHDPARGLTPWQRLQVSFVPDARITQPRAGMSPERQLDDVRQLEAMAQAPASPGAVPVTLVPPSAPPPAAATAAPAAAPPSAPASAPAATATDSPVDHLASWILSLVDPRELENRS